MPHKDKKARQEYMRNWAKNNPNKIRHYVRKCLVEKKQKPSCFCGGGVESTSGFCRDHAILNLPGMKKNVYSTLLYETKKLKVSPRDLNTEIVLLYCLLINCRLELTKFRRSL